MVTATADTARTWSWWPVIVLGALAAATTAVVVAGWTTAVDEWWLGVMQGVQAAPVETVARGFDLLGTFWGVTGMLAVGAIGLVVAGWWRLAMVWSAIVVVAQAGSSLGKALVGGDRPQAALLAEPTASYPSGHAMVAGAAIGLGLAAACALAWPHRRRQAVVAGTVWTFVMAGSRTYLLVHWLSDVVGGALLGATLVAATMALLGPALADTPGGAGTGRDPATRIPGAPAS